MERLQKVIAESGYASRRKAEELIKAGKVYVNGNKVTEMGFKVSGNDLIDINGKPLKKEDKEYYLLNKPRGVVTTTSDDKNRKTVTDLIETPKRIYPIGRLDYDTTGVLLLTNDGELTNILNHPSSEVSKIYVAKIDGIVEPFKVKKLEQGVIIDGVKTSKAKIRIKKLDKKNNASYIEITIHEGKNHQVKKMFEAIGYKVTKLKREKYAFLDVKSLKSGEYRKLTTKEVKSLYALGKNRAL
jgi:23S rRNA pseudouridine2605 synthase